MVDGPTRSALRVISDIVNAACVDARGLIDEAINWGDLRCVDARYYVSVSGEEGYEVLIEEASPDCPEFCRFVYDRLEQHGFKGVEVRTEW